MPLNHISSVTTINLVAYLGLLSMCVAHCTECTFAREHWHRFSRRL